MIIQDHNGEAKQRAAYAMLGRLDVPADAAAAGLQRKPSDGEQPSPGDRAAAAGREVYILAAADAVEGALNSHRVWKPHFLPPMRHSGAHLAHAWAPQRIKRRLYLHSSYSAVSRFPGGWACCRAYCRVLPSVSLWRVQRGIGYWHRQRLSAACLQAHLASLAGSASNIRNDGDKCWRRRRSRMLPRLSWRERARRAYLTPA